VLIGEIHPTLRQNSIQLLDQPHEPIDGKKWSWITLDNQCSSLEFLDSRS